MSVIDTIRGEIENVLDKHSSEIEAAMGATAEFAGSPLAAAALAAVHLPPSTGEAFAMFLERLDADFAKMIPTVITPAPTLAAAPAPALVAVPVPDAPQA